MKFTITLIMFIILITAGAITGFIYLSIYLSCHSKKGYKLKNGKCVKIGTGNPPGGPIPPAPEQGELWRYPYQSPYKSPFVKINAADGLPDFMYQDKDDNPLQKNQLACPPDVILQCVIPGGTVSSGDEKFVDGKKVCYGGLYCDISKQSLGNKQLFKKYFPNYIGPNNKKKKAPLVKRTRKNILERAIGWLAVHAPYIGQPIPKKSHDGMEMCASNDPAKCPQYSYTLTCEGLISMAWGTYGYGGGPGAIAVNHTDLKPGDSIPIHKFIDGQFKGINHFLLFRSWVDESMQQAVVWQMGGEHGTANKIIIGSSNRKINWLDSTDTKKYTPTPYKPDANEEQAIQIFIVTGENPPVTSSGKITYQMGCTKYANVVEE